MSAQFVARGRRHVDIRGVGKCLQSEGWHVYAAGPCFVSTEEAIAYRDRLDFAEEVYWPSDKPWPPNPPQGWINPRSQQPEKGERS